MVVLPMTTTDDDRSAGKQQPASHCLATGARQCGLSVHRFPRIKLRAMERSHNLMFFCRLFYQA